MPRYSRSYRRNWGRWPYRSWRGYSSPSTAGTRRFTVSVPVQDAFTMTVAAGSYWSSVFGLSPYYANSNLSSPRRLYHASLPMSGLYKTYCQLYDEVKINSVSVAVSLMSSVGISGVVPALKFFTSWDRQACANEIVYENGAPSATQLELGSESQCTLVSNTSSMTVRRFNRASDLIEKVTFHDCSLETSGTITYDKTYNDPSGRTPIGYCPAMFFAINTATSPTTGTTFSFNISLEVRWNVTFRNPKFGLSSGSAKIASFNDMRAGAIEDFVADSAPTSEVKEEVPSSPSVEMSDDLNSVTESSQPELTREELLEMLKKYEDKKS